MKTTCFAVNDLVRFSKDSTFLFSGSPPISVTFSFVKYIGWPSMPLGNSLKRIKNGSSFLVWKTFSIFKDNLLYPVYIQFIITLFDFPFIIYHFPFIILSTNKKTNIDKYIKFEDKWTLIFYSSSFVDKLFWVCLNNKRKNCTSDRIE